MRETKCDTVHTLEERERERERERYIRRDQASCIMHNRTKSQKP